MKNIKKSEYLQIRVSKQEKELIKSAAQSANMDMSAWLLKRALYFKSKIFNTIISKFSTEHNTFVLAELHDFLHDLNRNEFEMALSIKPNNKLTDFQINYTIAMIAHRANQLNTSPPDWTCHFSVLKKPYFGTNLKSLRLHLLINSPIAFKQRNIYIDSSIGDRV